MSILKPKIPYAMFRSMGSYDEKAIAEFRKQSRNLSPFDAIEPPPGMRGRISPLPITNKVRRNLTSFCEHALDKYNNDQGTNFVFANIVKATRQRVSGTNYFMTFQAKYPNCTLVTFQAYVFVKLPCNGGHPVVQSCAIKPT